MTPDLVVAGFNLRNGDEAAKRNLKVAATGLGSGLFH